MSTHRPVSAGFLTALALFVALTAAVMGAPPAWAQDPANPDCQGRFQFYEATARMAGARVNQHSRSASPRVREAARWLRMGNCLTFTDQLRPMLALGPETGAAARTPAGPAIAPTQLHVGIVTSPDDEARTIAFFAAQGIRARSVGAAYLGRRIYIGPFTTAGALDGGAALARAAGFAYPYPSSF